MRLCHKQKESYIMAKGSFAGVFASLDEIRTVHEMHPDFRASMSHHPIEPDLEDASASSTLPSYENVAANLQARSAPSSSRRGTLQVQADVEPASLLRGSALHPHGKTRSGQKAPFQPVNGGITGEATFGDDALSHRAASRGGLDYYDTGKDFESRGVVDEDGKNLFLCWTKKMNTNAWRRQN